MSKMTLAWVESQIEQEIERGNRPEAVRDLAALAMAREYLHGKGCYHGELTAEKATKWVEGMHNVDTERPKGAMWQQTATDTLADKRGFDTEPEKLEFWAVINMMHSDYAKVAEKHGVDKPDFYADMAAAWMRDKDAVADKTSAYIDCCAE